MNKKKMDISAVEIATKLFSECGFRSKVTAHIDNTIDTIEMMPKECKKIEDVIAILKLSKEKLSGLRGF